MKIFLDNGHGSDTPGKRSPDGTFLEYHYNRLLASRITSRLQLLNYDAEILVPEKTDISLKERCCRIKKRLQMQKCSGVKWNSKHFAFTASHFCANIPIFY